MSFTSVYFWYIAGNCWWMDGWVDGLDELYWMDGGWIGWTGWVNGWIGWMDWTDGWMDWMDGLDRSDRWILSSSTKKDTESHEWVVFFQFLGCSWLICVFVMGTVPPPWLNSTEHPSAFDYEASGSHPSRSGSPSLLASAEEVLKLLIWAYMFTVSSITN